MKFANTLHSAAEPSQKSSSPMRVTIVLIALLLTILEWWLLPSHSWVGIGFTLAHCALLVGVIWAPMLCADLLVILHVAWMFTTHGVTGTTQLWGLWTATAIAADDCEDNRTIALPLICTVSAFTERSFVRNEPISSSLMIALTYWAAWLLGRLVQITRQRNHARQRQQQLARQEQIASQIHDALSAELSYLMLHMRRNAADPQFDEKSRAEFTAMAQNAGDALRKVRDIVHELSPDEQTASVPPSTTGQRDNAQLLCEDIGHNEPMLRDLGFTGSISVHGDLRTLPTPALEFARTVLTELVANIIRHGEPAHYLVQIAIDDSLRIESHNRVRTASRLPRSGHGLAALRRAVAQRHGTVTAQLDGDTWHTVVTVPLPFFSSNIYTGRKG